MTTSRRAALAPSPVLDWLLEKRDPCVRYFALRDLLGRPEDDPEVRQAQAAIMTSGPVPAILAAQQPEGEWVKPGSGYSPKYRGTVWQVIFLAQLGADGCDPRVQQGAGYVMEHNRCSYGGFSIDGRPTGLKTASCPDGEGPEPLQDPRRTYRAGEQSAGWGAWLKEKGRQTGAPSMPGHCDVRRCR